METDNQITKCINQIRKRPGMYLGGKQICQLRSFLDGFRFCLNQNNILESSYLPTLPFFLFHEYTARHFGETSACKGYALILQEHCEGDGEQALEQFFALYDSFCQVAVQSIKRALSPDGETCFYKLLLSGNTGYLLIKKQEKYVVQSNVIPFEGYFIQQEASIDRYVAAVYDTPQNSWTDTGENYLFSESGFPLF